MATKIRPSASGSLGCARLLRKFCKGNDATHDDGEEGKQGEEGRDPGQNVIGELEQPQMLLVTVD